MIDALYNGGLNLIAQPWWMGIAWPVLWILIKIVCILAPLMGAVAYLTLWERKLLGFMQVRMGPNRLPGWPFPSAPMWRWPMSMRVCCWSWPSPPLKSMA